MYKLYAIINTTGIDIFYKILCNELWKIIQPYLITGIWA